MDGHTETINAAIKGVTALPENSLIALYLPTLMLLALVLGLTIHALVVILAVAQDRRNPIDGVAELNQFLLAEILLQAVLCATGFVEPSYIMLALNLPILLKNLEMCVRGRHRYDTKKLTERSTWLEAWAITKIVLYSIMIIYCLVRLLLALFVPHQQLIEFGGHVSRLNSSVLANHLHNIDGMDMVVKAGALGVVHTANLGVEAAGLLSTANVFMGQGFEVGPGMGLGGAAHQFHDHARPPTKGAKAQPSKVSEPK